MKFGVREICNVVFRATQNVKIGSVTFAKGQPVFYIDSAKTSTVEGAATTVYATGGRGNTRLIAWEGEKTLTFTVEDALLSPVSFAMLSGAGLVKGASNGTTEVHFHQTSLAVTDAVDGSISLRNALNSGEDIDEKAPIYIMKTDVAGDLTGEVLTGYAVAENGGSGTGSTDKQKLTKSEATAADKDQAVMVDYYVIKNEANVYELQIDAENFAGYYYVEADTLFRRQIDGKDLPANLTFPNVKIQSNFTFSMSSSGDPSTFTFTMDAFPGYTYFDKEKKVLCAIQIVDDVKTSEKTHTSVFKHDDNENIDLKNSETNLIFGSSDSVQST